MKLSLTLDAAGRVVLPLHLRRQFRLARGSVLDIELTSEEIVMRPRKQARSLVEEAGLVVHEGEPTGDLVSAVQASRRDRDRELAGPLG